MDSKSLPNEEKSFQMVSDELGLWVTPDWGIINSDAQRVTEFIQYVFDHPNLKSSTQFEFVELIAASMNDAIMEGIDTPEMNAIFRMYILTILPNDILSGQANYWVRIKNMEEFPVGFLIERIMEE